jgi:hypothetical protein
MKPNLQNTSNVLVMMAIEANKEKIAPYVKITRNDDYPAVVTTFAFKETTPAEKNDKSITLHLLF